MPRVTRRSAFPSFKMLASDPARRGGSRIAIILKRRTAPTATCASGEAKSAAGFWRADGLVPSSCCLTSWFYNTGIVTLHLLLLTTARQASRA